MKHRKEVPIGEGTLILETGHLAKQADGSCTVRLGDTVVLATACMDTKAGVTRDFLPLTVDYREYTYAAGRIPGGFFKREGRPTEKEIITSRLIDRPLRPLFPDGYTSETQIIAFVLSADGENDPDILAINGASTALVLSEIPFYHPIGAVRVGLIDGEIVINPTNSQRDVSDLDLVVVRHRGRGGHGRGRRQPDLRVADARLHLQGAPGDPEDHQGPARALPREQQARSPHGSRRSSTPRSSTSRSSAELHGELKAALFTRQKHERKAAVTAGGQGLPRAASPPRTRRSATR